MGYNKLEVDDYVPYAPDDEGSVTICHKDNCDNGTDHKPRLAISRMSDGVIKAFCHNCQSAGVYRPDEYIRPIEDLLEPDDPNSPLTLPTDMLDIEDIALWPVKVKAELFKYDIEYHEISWAGLGYSPGLKRLIIPIYNEDGNLMRWEGRDFSGKGPKYIKYRVPGATTLFKPVGVNHTTAVLCEDFVSAIRVHRCDVSAYALGGVALPEDQLIHLSEKHDNLLIFLDDDNPTVIQASERIRRDADPIFKKVLVVTNPMHKDPKRYDRIQLNMLIQREKRLLDKH